MNVGSKLFIQTLDIFISTDALAWKSSIPTPGNIDIIDWYQAGSLLMILSLPIVSKYLKLSKVVNQAWILSQIKSWYLKFKLPIYLKYPMFESEESSANIKAVKLNAETRYFAAWKVVSCMFASLSEPERLLSSPEISFWQTMIFLWAPMQFSRIQHKPCR